MSEIPQSMSDIPIEDPISEAGASLASILCTEELQRRPSRPPDYEKENCALVRGADFRKAFIDKWQNFFPRRLLSVRNRSCLNLFALTAAKFHSHRVDGGVTHNSKQPARQIRFAPQRRCFPREDYEHRLRYIFGDLALANLPQSDRINPIAMTRKKF